MRKILLLVWIILSLKAWAGLEGIWEGALTFDSGAAIRMREATCDNDVIQGKLNYKFKAGNVKVYLQYYNVKKRGPKEKVGKEIQLEGSYIITRHESNDDEKETYIVQIDYHTKNASGAKIVKAILVKDTMHLWENNRFRGTYWRQTVKKDSNYACIFSLLHCNS